MDLRRSRRDWEDTQKEHAEKTEVERAESRDVQRDVTDTIADWNDQPDPTLLETVRELRVEVQRLELLIIETHREQSDVTTETVEEQKREVSEPAREDEEVERQAAEGLETGAQRDGRRFGEVLSEGAAARQEAEAFLRETAETDEAHQEQTHQELAEIDDEVNRAIERIEDFGE